MKFSFNFTRPVFGFLLHTQHILFVSVCLKTPKQATRQPGGKFADLVTFFPKTGENIDATGSVTEGCDKLLCGRSKPSSYSVWHLQTK